MESQEQGYRRGKKILQHRVWHFRETWSQQNSHAQLVQCNFLCRRALISQEWTHNIQGGRVLEMCSLLDKTTPWDMLSTAPQKRRRWQDCTCPQGIKLFRRVHQGNNSPKGKASGYLGGKKRTQHKQNK